MNNHQQLIVYFLILCYFVSLVSNGSDWIIAELEPGVKAVCRGSYRIHLEFQKTDNRGYEELLTYYLADSREATKYAKVRSVAVPFERIRTDKYPEIFVVLFPRDSLDQEGWWHTVPTGFSLGKDALELWCLALTGSRENVNSVLKHPQNRKLQFPLKTGQRVLIPKTILRSEIFTLKKPIQTGTVLQPLEPKDEEMHLDMHHCTESNGNGLRYGKDSQGEYAIYVIQPGETLYRIIVRFTDFQEHKDILEACEVLKKRNDIADERNVEKFTPIKIPMELLSDRYLPAGTERREVYEQVKRESVKIAQSRQKKKKDITRKPLKNVVIVIDPGHGGRDHGAAIDHRAVYEDEINYDIACRLKAYLERNTEAKVYMTLQDVSDGFTPVKRQRFSHDTDEVILVSPSHNPQSAPVSAHLRTMLANRIKAEEEKKGVLIDNMLYLSIHCDSIYKSEIRGMMVYIPGANYRNRIESINGRNSEIDYTALEEWKYHRSRSLTLSDRVRDEAMSRRFAEELIRTARQQGIAVHSEGPPIRNVIRKSKNNVYLPAVLRNIEIPTKVLVECLNLQNPHDIANAQNPAWRQKMAETLGKAIEEYFK